MVVQWFLLDSLESEQTLRKVKKRVGKLKGLVCFRWSRYGQMLSANERNLSNEGKPNTITSPLSSWSPILWDGVGWCWIECKVMISPLISPHTNEASFSPWHSICCLHLPKLRGMASGPPQKVHSQLHCCLNTQVKVHQLHFVIYDLSPMHRTKHQIGPDGRIIMPKFTSIWWSKLSFSQNEEHLGA